MKVTAKTVTGTSFQLDLDESLTVAETKAKIESSQGANFPKDRQVRPASLPEASALGPPFSLWRVGERWLR